MSQAQGGPRRAQEGPTNAQEGLERPNSLCLAWTFQGLTLASKGLAMAFQGLAWASQGLSRAFQGLALACQVMVWSLGPPRAWIAPPGA